MDDETLNLRTEDLINKLVYVINSHTNFMQEIGHELDEIHIKNVCAISGILINSVITWFEDNRHVEMFEKIKEYIEMEQKEIIMDKLIKKDKKKIDKMMDDLVKKDVPRDKKLEKYDKMKKKGKC